MAIGTNEEEIRLRLGYDATSVTAGTAAMLRNQDIAAAKYIDIWRAATKTRESMETQANIASANAEYLRQKKLANLIINGPEAQARKVQAANANAQMAAGSGAFGSIEAAAAGAGATAAGKGIAEAGHEGSKLGTVFRETAVIFREGLRGNFTRMIGSFTILLSAIGSAISAAVFPIVAGTALLTGLPAWRTYKAYEDKGAGEVDLKNNVDDTADMLKTRIERMQKNGTLKPDLARHWMNLLKKPTYENVSDILNQTTKLLGADAANEQKKAYEKRTKEYNDAAEPINAKDHTLKEFTDDMNFRLKAIINIKNEMMRLDKNSVEYAYRNSLIAYHHLQIEKDRHEIKQKQDALDQKKKIDSQNATNLYREIIQNARELDQLGAEYSSIEDIAGRRWSKRFAAKYGKGGIYDLGSGNGFMADIAREYQRAKYQQEYDRNFTQSGDWFDEHTLQWRHVDRNAIIKSDQDRMNAARGKLEDAGLLAPNLAWQKINENTAAMNTHLNHLINEGAVINTKVQDDN